MKASSNKNRFCRNPVSGASATIPYNYYDPGVSHLYGVAFFFSFFFLLELEFVVRGCITCIGLSSDDYSLLVVVKKLFLVSINLFALNRWLCCYIVVDYDA